MICGCSKIFVFTYWLLSSWSLYTGNLILAELINIGDSDSLYLEWKPSNVSLIDCRAVMPSSKQIPLKPDQQEDGVKYLGDGLDNGSCGAQILHLEPKHKGNWSLRAVDFNNVKAVKNYTVNIVHERSINRTITVIDSTTEYIKCGPDESVYCELSSPKMELNVFDKACTLSVSVNKEKHEGVWTCRYALEGYTTLLSSTIQLYVEALKRSDVGYNETGTEMNIFCNAIQERMVHPFCLVVTPDGTELNLGAGRGTHRYRYYGRAAAHCGVTIPKPLGPQEYGSWLCSLRSTSNTPTYYGGYVLIKRDPSAFLQNDDPTSIVKDMLKATPSYIFVQTNGQLTLRCHANLSLKYCWFRDSNGSSFSSKMDELDFGKCSYDISQANASHSGLWTCSAGISNFGVVREIQAKITVDVADHPLLGSPKSSNKATGESVTLLCKHPQESSLQYCRFVRPDGLAFTVTDSKITQDGNYRYAGRGLIMGECGIKITSIRESDYGSWTCATETIHNTSNKKNYLWTVLVLKPPEGLSLATSLWISFGSLILVIIIGIIVTKYFIPLCKKKHEDETILLNETSSFQVVQSSRPVPLNTFSYETGARIRRKMYRPKILY